MTVGEENNVSVGQIARSLASLLLFWIAMSGVWMTLLLLTGVSCFGQLTEDASQQENRDVARAPIAYQSPPEPGCDAYTMDSIPVLGLKRKGCFYRDRLLTGSAMFGAGFFAAMAQLRHDPKEWPQGADGFGRRFGTRYAQGIAKSTGSFLVGALNHEDPRPHPPVIPGCAHNHVAKTGFLPRTGDALLRTVWAHRDNCSDGIALSHFAGALSSGFIGRAWIPDRSNSIGQAFSRSGTAFGGDVAASVFSEFQGDIFGFFGRMFGSGKPKK